MVKSNTLPISDLLINTDNYRFEPVSGQKEAIDKVIEDQDEKLFALAENMLKNGLNPNDKVMVAKSSHDKTKFIVLEGNRRVVALKVLNNPDLIDQIKYSPLKKKFKHLKDDNKREAIKEIECLVFDDPSDADKWIKLKHTGENDGIGTVTWDSIQKARFYEKVEGKSPIALQAIRMLQTSNDVPADVKKRLPELRITNFDRLLSDPNVKDLLGVSVEKDRLVSNVDAKEVVKGLTQIAKDILDPSFTVKRIYTKEDREDYIKNFPVASRPDTNKVGKSWSAGQITTSTSATGKSRKSLSKNRKALIPRSCSLKIDNPKIDAIYNELQKLSVDSFTNASGVLLRVFVELSADVFIEKNKVPRLTVSSTLVSKIIGIADYLENNDLADKHMCKGIRSAVINQHGLLGVSTWHAYVHNSRFAPTPKDLFVTWDNIQGFVEKLWENVK